MTDTVSSTNSTSLYGSPDTNITLATPTQSSDERSIDSKNFTTLYSNATSFTSGTVNSSVYSVSGGAGISVNPTTGNVVVTNTGVTSIVAGTNISVSSATGAVTVNATDTNTTYNIDASSTTGGANLNLVGSDATTDSVKFAGSGDTTITRTDANTITISSTSGSTIPNGTAKGQVLYWNGSAWTANSTITSAASADRLRVVYENSDAGANSAIFARKDYTTSTYTTNDGVGIGFQLDSNSQNLNQLAAIYAVWNATAPIISLNTNINDNTAGPFLSVGDFTTAQATLPGDLAVNGGDITTTQTTASLFNTTATTLNIGGAATTVNIAAAYPSTTTLRGDGVVNGILKVLGDAVYINYDDTATDSVLSFKGVSGEYLKWNNTDARFEFSENVLASGWLGAQADIIYINWDNTAIDSYLSFKGINNEYIKWNNTDTRFEFSDQIYNSQTDIPAVFERRTLSTDISPYEQKSGVKLLNRVTDAANNDTVTTGPCVIFGRTSGATTATERLFATMGSAWDGPTQTASLAFNWSSDNFTETPPGVFPNTYTLLELDSNFAKFQNNSIYIDYDTAGSALVGINTGTPTYTLDVNGNANVTGTITVEGVLVDLTTPVHQGQLLYVSNDSTPTITNSSTINFSNTTYRPNFQQDSGIYGRTQSGAQISGNTGAVAYTTGDGGSLLIGIQSDSQALNSIGSISTAYNTSGDHEMRLNTSTNGFAPDQATSITGSNTLVFSTAHGFSIGNKLRYVSSTQNGLVYDTTYYVIATGFTTTQCQVSLTLGGSAVALTNGTGLSLWFYNGITRILAGDSATISTDAKTLIFNATNTGIAFTGTAGIEIERGTTGANQTFVWNETSVLWEASGSLYVADTVIGGNALATNGNNIYYNNENSSPAGTCNLIVKSGVSAGVDSNFRWNDTTERWQDTIDGTNYFNLPNQNLDTTDGPTFSNVNIDGQATLDSSTLTTTATTTVALNTSARNVMSGLINIIQGANVHCLNYTALRVDATTAMLTTYGEMYNNSSLASFTADVSAGSLRLLVTPASATSTIFSVVRTSLT